MTIARKLSSLTAAAVLCVGFGSLQAQSPSSSNPPAGKLPAVIPIFPLEETTLFPGIARPFYIFEPRYRAMVADALKGDRIIGMITLKPGFETQYGGRPPTYETGCAGFIEDVEELSGGRYNIVLRGLVKFRVVSEDQSRPYRLARVESIPEVLTTAERAALHKQRPTLEALVTKGSDSRVPPAWSDEELVNTIAQHMTVQRAERQILLELKNALVRSEALIALIQERAR
jgi:Lon protease-like protein